MKTFAECYIERTQNIIQYLMKKTGVTQEQIDGLLLPTFSFSAVKHQIGRNPQYIRAIYKTVGEHYLLAFGRNLDVVQIALHRSPYSYYHQSDEDKARAIFMNANFESRVQIATLELFYHCPWSEKYEVFKDTHNIDFRKSSIKRLATELNQLQDDKEKAINAKDEDAFLPRFMDVPENQDVLSRLYAQAHYRGMPAPAMLSTYFQLVHIDRLLAANP